MSVTNAGFAAIAGLVGDTGSVTAFSYIAYGSGTTAFAATQTALVTESTREASTVSRVTTTVTNDTVQFYKVFSITSTETIAEVGVFNGSSGGTMLARKVLDTARSVVSGDSFTCTYKVKFA